MGINATFQIEVSDHERPDGWDWRVTGYDQALWIFYRGLELDRPFEMHVGSVLHSVFSPRQGGVLKGATEAFVYLDYRLLCLRITGLNWWAKYVPSVEGGGPATFVWKSLGVLEERPGVS